MSFINSEKENIYTLSPDSDQALGIHALLADWESGNKSRRMILSYDQRIMTGQYPLSDLLGYRHTKNGQLVMVPDEAKTVRFAFLAYISGYTYKEIADILTAKERKTMQGRQVWNEGMVQNIFQNERRWGDLRARKTIVIDYKHGKSKRNDDEERCGAYVPNHHEGIVSPGIARAAQFLSKSADNLEKVQLHSKVITTGALQGFVNINPYWAGVNNESLFELSRNAYTDDEIIKLYERRDIIEGEKHSKAIDMKLGNYQVSYGIYYLTQKMPSLTFTIDGITFNKACHMRFDNCKSIEMYYHPILQTIIIRKSNSDDSFNWVNSRDEALGSMSARAFANAVYENLAWRKDYKFRFRGITKIRGDEKIILFFLDEPQILLGRKQKKELELQGIDLSTKTSFVPYRDETCIEKECVMSSRYGYPAEWNHSLGMSYELKNKREQEIKKISEKDIQTFGVRFNNPLLGDMPDAEELEDEVNALLMSM